MIRVGFSGKPELWNKWHPHLTAGFEDAGQNVDLTDAPDTETEYVLYAPNGPVQDFSNFPKLKAVLSLWAGVEKVVANPTLTVPLARMIDPGLTQGMIEYVTGHVLRHHLGMDTHIHNTSGEWRFSTPPLAPERSVGILGLGELGQASARALTSLGFDVHGWSRSTKDIAGITCHSGDAGLQALLEVSEIVVLLLPHTPDTRNIVSASELARLPKGAVLINPGRGELIDDDALLDALETGQISHATLDVFRTEPLPEEHPYWAHTGVTITPHVAADTRPSTAAIQIARNIQRFEAGDPLIGLVDRSAGY